MKTFNDGAVITDLLELFFLLIAQRVVGFQTQCHFYFPDAARVADHMFGYIQRCSFEVNMHRLCFYAHRGDDACGQGHANGIGGTEAFAFSEVISGGIRFQDAAALGMGAFAAEVTSIDDGCGHMAEFGAGGMPSALIKGWGMFIFRKFTP